MSEGIDAIERGYQTLSQQSIENRERRHAQYGQNSQIIIQR